MSRRRRASFVVPALLLVALAVVLTNVLPLRQIIAQRRSVDLARQQLELLQEENARLEVLAAALKTDTEVERLARENLGYVREGEIAYQIVDPAEPEAARPDRRHDDAGGEEQTFLRQVWDFLTGADLVDAGVG